MITRFPTEYQQMQERLDIITHDPKEVESIFLRIAEGENLTGIALSLDVSYIHLSRFLRGNEELSARLVTAEQTRDMARKDGVTQVFDEMSYVDPLDAYKDDMTLKPLSEMPESLRRSIAEIETEELFAGRGDGRELIGYLKKVKFYNKLQANERRGKALGMFTDKLQVSGDMNLAGMSEAQLDQMIVREIVRLPIDTLASAMKGLPRDVLNKLSARIDEILSDEKTTSEK